MEELAHNISTCHLCDLSKSRTQSMSGYGNPHADLMFIDFRVSNIEDQYNNYFSGKSGEMLSKMITNVLDLRVEDLYFTHIVKCKTLDGMQNPSASEIQSCMPYLNAQIEFVKPKIIVTLGEDAYSAFTNETENFQSVRGHVIDYKNYKLIPLFHPQYLLRNPDSKKVAFSDLKTVKSCL